MRRIVQGTFLCALLVLLAAPTVWAGPPRSNPTVHIVQWGENLTSISRRYGTTIQAIVAANRLANPNRIYAGQRLVIPCGAAPSPTGGCAYVIQYGDTLSGIAYRHGVSINSVVQANNLVNPNRIYAGQRLVIPCASSTTPASPTGGTYYTVRKGDTLAQIALRFRARLWSIVAANNIANPNVIYTGQRLYIPAASSSAGWIKPGCEHLTWPREGARLSGVIQAWGTAKIDNQWYYKLEYRKDGLDDWHYITGAEAVVQNGPLGAWDTRTVSDGGYTFRLVAVDWTGNYPPPCEIAVRVNNDP